MFIKGLLLSSFLTSDPATVIAMPPEKIEARRRGGKGNKKRSRGGSGLR